MTPRHGQLSLFLAVALGGSVGCADLTRPNEIAIYKPPVRRPAPAADGDAPAAPRQVPLPVPTGGPMRRGPTPPPAAHP